MGGVLRIEALRKRFHAPTGATITIVDVPHFEIEPRAHVALAGESGSGKTTFLHLIAGILEPDAGTVEIAGERITGVGESRRDRVRAGQLGYIFQTFNLLQGYTAMENVELAMMFGRGLDRAYARRLLAQVGLSDRLHYRPRQLSVGQQQRVAVARALANKPALVLADEPTGNLDRRHAAAALELIRSLCRENEAALLLVSHDPHVLDSFEKRYEFEALNRAIDATATGQGAAVHG